MNEFLNNLVSVYVQYPAMLYVSILLLGLITGSFLNVVIYRLPVMMEREWREQCEELAGTSTKLPSPEKFNLTVPRSRCRNCGHKIKAWENIPVLSYLLLKGRCSECKIRISLQYPAVELITGVLSVWVAVHFGLDWRLPAALILTWALIALSVIDIKETL
ncbi:MAG TPA: prepilin peptidase, partial [Gammaproteobacteria bacterium]